jgi:hypothetical protein
MNLCLSLAVQKDNDLGTASLVLTDDNGIAVKVVLETREGNQRETRDTPHIFIANVNIRR